MSNLENMGGVDLLERLAKGIVAVVGSHCEVVVHDFTDLEHSAIIVEGNLSGRQQGAPIPDLDFISDELGAETPDQLNYRIEIDSKEFQSSTIWIRDTEGMPVGAVCINLDFSKLNHVYNLVGELTTHARQQPYLTVQDTLAKDMDSLINLSLNAYLRQENIDGVDAMSHKDKIEFIKLVEERGLFKLRGAAARLAEIMNVSRASIYNYRADVKNQNITIQSPTL